MTQHPDTEVLAAWVLAPQTGAGDLSEHLAECGECRQRLARLAGIHEQLQRGPVPVSRPSLDEQTLAEFAEGRLSASEQQRVAAVVNGDRDNLRASLHYIVSSARLRREGVATDAAPASHGAGTVVVPGQSLPARLWRWLWRPGPAWAGFGVAATAALVMAVGVGPMLVGDAGQTRIASYQDEAVIRYQAAGETPPGIGFFAGARVGSEPYAGLRVAALAGAGYLLDWPAVDGALAYTLVLNQVRGGDQVEVLRRETGDTRLRLDASVLEHGGHYRWLLSGQTADGRVFQAEGGFVISQ